MQQNPIDSLSKFGISFQQKCISSLLSDKTFIEQIIDILDPTYFDNDAHQWIITEIKSYFNNYKQLITLDVFKVRIDTLSGEELKRSIIDQLKLIYQKIKDQDIIYIKEQFLNFCKNQKLKTAICDSVDLLKIGQYEKIKQLVDDALKAGMEQNVGHDYLNDIDERMTNIIRQTVSTNWEVIDELMDGGLGSGELGVIVAPAGIGKSWGLVKLGAEAMKSGKNVAHITLELNENYVGRRYDSCFTRIDFKDIPNEIGLVKESLNKVTGKLFIKKYPIKSISANSIKAYVERLRMLGTRIDLLVVDYADILRSMSSDKNSNSYSDAGNIYEELRTVLDELGIPGWTASQTNRCLSLQTIVYKEVTNECKISELKIGDKILTNNGYKKVSNIFPIIKQPVYRIKLKSGKSIDCSINHKFPTRYGKFLSIEHGLSVGDKLFVKK